MQPLPSIGADGIEDGKTALRSVVQKRIAVMQRGVGGVRKGHELTYTLSDGKKIQNVTDVVTETVAVMRAVSFQQR